MDVILHVGAHRTASTTFQHYLRENGAELQRRGVGFWGPLRTRAGLFAGLHAPAPGPLSAERQFALACGRVAMNAERARRSGLRHLLVSDENILGSPRHNLRTSRLYPDAGDRVSRVVQAFGGRVARIVLQIRSQDDYWTSCLAFAVARGHGLPDADRLDRLVTQPRAWRHIVQDIARVAPGAALTVIPHEAMAGLPERRLWHATGGAVHGPSAHARSWLNAAPDLPALRRAVAERPDAGLLDGGMRDTPDGQDAGISGAARRDTGRTAGGGAIGSSRWHPFDPVQAATLREVYHDDLYWLRAGAEGLAELADAPWTPATRGPGDTGQGTTGSAAAGTHPPGAPHGRGQAHDIEEGRVVGHR